MALCLSEKPTRRVDNSPFLNLPPEIRNRIYQVALISSKPIELCSSDFVLGVVDMEDLASRHPSYNPFLSPRLMNQLRVRQEDLHYRYDVIRLQKDLLHVRQELAAGLLSTCRQIRFEAADYFWGDNEWHFTRDTRWHELYRFLLTIGPMARARIRKLSVWAPFTGDPTGGNVHFIHDVPFKNHPKMYMAKTTGCYTGSKECDCRRRVYEIIMRDETLARITFVVPPSFWVYSLYGDNEPPEGFFPKITVVISPFAWVDDWVNVEDFTSRGVGNLPS